MNFQMNNTLRVLAATAVVAIASLAHSATLNFSSLETVLADPTDMASKMHAAWTGWQTEVAENNTPFISLTNEAGQPAILSMKMTIGDTAYKFGTQFKNKAKTNAWDIPVTGQPALLGKSTPNVVMTSTLVDGDNAILLTFGNGGLQAGQRVIFQVDIDQDASGVGTMMFAPYTDVFFTPNGGADTSGNSVVTIDYAGLAIDSMVTLPNFAIANGMGVSLSSPRPYNQMQMVPTFPNTSIDPVPEPSAQLILAGVAAIAAGIRRRGYATR